MEIRGKVHEIGSVQHVTDTFKKRDLIIAYSENPEYVEYIKFEATQDKTDLFDNLKVEEEVDVYFNFRGRAWTNKDGVTSYFNSLVAWKVSKAGSGSSQSSEPTHSLPDDSDLPF